MSLSLSLRLQAAHSPLVSRPLTLPVVPSDRSTTLFDDADDDMRRLTAAIDHVLSGRSGARMVSPDPAAGYSQASLSTVVPAIDAPDNDALTFEWEAANDATGHDVSDRAAGWMKRARRERRFERLRSALSWCMALAVVAGIVVAVALGVRGPEAVVSTWHTFVGLVGL
jgi:hypothetical protein